MQITVSLHGVFRIDRFKMQTLDVPTGCTIQDIVATLQLSPDLLGTVLINRTHAKLTDVLHAGDTLMILPLLEGG